MCACKGVFTHPPGDALRGSHVVVEGACLVADVCGDAVQEVAVKGGGEGEGHGVDGGAWAVWVGLPSSMEALCSGVDVRAVTQTNRPCHQLNAVMLRRGMAGESVLSWLTFSSSVIASISCSTVVVPACYCVDIAALRALHLPASSQHSTTASNLMMSCIGGACRPRCWGIMSPACVFCIDQVRKRFDVNTCLFERILAVRIDDLKRADCQ